MGDDKATDNPLDAARLELVEKAKKDGKIDQREIFAQIPDVPDNADILDLLYTELADNSLEITSANEPNVEEFTDEWAAEEGEEEIVLSEQTYLDDISDDSVRLYLREIGKIPLLNAEEELALAERVVSGD